MWTAFTIGILGSVHCIGMCGPIAMALPLKHDSKRILVTNLLLYNLGRTFTYILLGFIIGLLGKGVWLAGWQSHLSIIMGVSLLFVVLFSIDLERKLLSFKWLHLLYFHLKSGLARLLKQPSKLGILGIGALNGLLPCGLVYLALIAALSLGNAFDGMLYMLFFGMGTIPLMLMAIWLGNSLRMQVNTKLRKAYPIFLTVLSFWLIYRGIQFELPPNFSFWEAMQNIPMCH